MGADISGMVADMVCRWAKKRVVAGSIIARTNLRLIFGTTALASLVRQELEQATSDTCWYIVRTSAEKDSVACRNNRPSVTPTGVMPHTPIIYVLFWLPNQPGHEQNKESLADLAATAYWQVLGDCDDLVLPAEELMDHRCEEAGKVWAKPALAAEHLKSAWRAVRSCIREDRGGKEASTPFFASLEAYADYLCRASIADDEWKEIVPNDRARRLVQAWGDALPALSMFRLPEMASLLGIVVDPQAAVSAKNQTVTWRNKLSEILSDNLDASMDFSKLADKIAGKSTVAKQLDALGDQVLLCRGDKQARIQARAALEKFCQDGDPAAYKVVDWQFREDPKNRNSKSHGIRGVLIARRSVTRTTPRDRAVRDTTALLVSLIPSGSGFEDTIEHYVESQGQLVASDNSAAKRVADLLRSLGSGQLPSMSLDAQLQPALVAVTQSPILDAALLDAEATRWDKLSGDQEDAVVECSNLLLGIAQLTAYRLKPAGAAGVLNPDVRPEPTDTLSLKLSGVSDTRVPALVLAAGKWDAETTEHIRLWLRDKVVPALDEAEGEDEEEEETDAIDTRDVTIDVFRNSATDKNVPLGQVILTWSPQWGDLVTSTSQGLLSWSLKQDSDFRSDSTLLRRLFGDSVIPLAISCPESVAKAWQAYRQALGTTKNWALAAVAGPAPKEARGWVDAWADAIDLGSNSGITPQQLFAEAHKAMQDGKIDQATALFKQAQEQVLGAAGSGGQRPTLDTIRGLLTVCTGHVTSSDGTPHRAALTPHHPLVCRLRVVSDSVLVDMLRLMWTTGWPEEAFEELEDALNNWGLPEPQHFYGWWIGGKPLVFDAWVRDVGFAWFSKLESGRTSDGAALGVSHVAYDLRRYRDLFPAANDRLRLRFIADRIGRWAARVTEGVRKDDDAFRADIDLITDLPDEEMTALEKDWQQDYERQRALEMSDDGSAPKVRVRRQTLKESEPVHANLVLGDTVDVFRAQHSTKPVADADHGIWDSSVLFAVQRPELRPHRFLIGDPSDDLGRRVSRAVAYVNNQSHTDVFVEQCTFDPQLVKAPLEQLHDKTHWLILASRHPLHRAVQQAGESVASLLDFRTASERGRPVHICVSVGTQQFGSDLARLESMLRLLVGEDLGSTGHSFVRVARRFAPRLAMSCAGAATPIEVEGLIGLLLTQFVVGKEHAGGVLLALDQHRGLLSGRGQLGDILHLRVESNDLLIGVAESKLSRNAVSPQHGVIEQARTQVNTTVARLQHFTSVHPLVPRLRSTLGRSIVDQIHLSEVADVEKSPLVGFLAAVLNPKTAIKVLAAKAAVVHVWSLDGSTQGTSVKAGDAATVVIHSRTDTLASLKEMLKSVRKK